MGVTKKDSLAEGGEDVQRDQGPGESFRVMANWGAPIGVARQRCMSPMPRGAPAAAAQRRRS